MPTYKITTPDGASYNVTAPDGASQEEVLAYAQSHHEKVTQPTQPTEPVRKSLRDRFIEQTDNLKRQAGLTARYGIEGLGDVVGIVGNPLSAITGAMKPADRATSIADSLDLPKPETPTEKVVGSMSRGLVGSGGLVGTGNILAKSPTIAANFGEMLSQQPIAQATSSIGAGLGSETAKQMGGGEGAQLAAGIVGSLAPNTIAGTSKLLGKGIANLTGMTSGAGGEAIKQATKAGFVGGDSKKSLTENMRGHVPMTNILDSVDENIQAMGMNKAAQYREGLKSLGKDQTILNFDKIDKAAKDAMNVSTYTGKNSGVKVSTAKSTLKVQDEISKLIDDWNKLPPEDFHTAEGFDALKKTIGDLRDSTPFNTPERHVVDKVYHAVKNQITDQAPEYANTMKEYQHASDLISEIRSTLSNKPNASVDTQMRKLQSLMRNNVNTNYGNRLELVKQMEQQGGREVIPAIAGQALNSITPRGLQQATATGTIGAGLYLHNPAMIPLLAAQSPRIVGETALKAGQLAGLVNKYTGKTVNTNKLKALLDSAVYGDMAANK